MSNYYMPGNYRRPLPDQSEHYKKAHEADLEAYKYANKNPPELPKTPDPPKPVDPPPVELPKPVEPPPVEVKPKISKNAEMFLGSAALAAAAGLGGYALYKKYKARNKKKQDKKVITEDRRTKQGKWTLPGYLVGSGLTPDKFQRKYLSQHGLDPKVGTQGVVGDEKPGYLERVKDKADQSLQQLKDNRSSVGPVPFGAKAAFGAMALTGAGLAAQKVLEWRAKKKKEKEGKRVRIDYL